MFGHGLGEEEERERGKRETEVKESVGRVIKGCRILLPQFLVVFQMLFPEMSEATALPALVFDMITVVLT